MAVLGILHSLGSAAGEVAATRADCLGHVVLCQVQVARPAERSTVTAAFTGERRSRSCNPGRDDCLPAVRARVHAAGATAPWARGMTLMRPGSRTGGQRAPRWPVSRVPVADSTRPPRGGRGCEDPGIGHRGGDDDVAGMGIADALDCSTTTVLTIMRKHGWVGPPRLTSSSSPVNR